MIMMYSEKDFNNIIKENEEYFEEKYSDFEKDFIKELYSDLDDIDKKEFEEAIEEVEKQYYDIVYPRCWNNRTLTAVKELYEY